jgi:NAD+ kinase
MSVANSTNPPRFSTVAIIGKHGEFGASSNTLGELADFLEHRGHRVVFEAATAQDLQRSTLVSMTLADIGQDADVAIVIGGDGTMLGIARQLAPFDVPLIGVNQGRLGFMTDIAF